MTYHDSIDNPRDASTWRILDAALNRAAEGLRVVEDFTRLKLADRHLTAELKQIRHELSAATRHLSRDWLLACRDTPGDPGTTIDVASEFERSGESAVVSANLARVQQALRTVEEFSKSISVDLASVVQQLRYRTYTLEKAIVTVCLSQQTLAAAGLCVLVDGGADADSFLRLMRQLIGAGVDLIQLRDKSLDDRTLIDRGRLLGELCTGTSTRWIMNDRADLALAANAHGVHLGQEDVPVAIARRILGPARIIGVSTHSIEQARAAVLDGANYIGTGPMFPGPTKQFSAYPGVELAREVAAEIALPAFAIGGITPASLGPVLAAGITRIAVSSAVTAAADPAAAVRQLKSQLGR